MAQEIGITKVIQGQVTAIGPEGSRSLSAGMPVFTGDTIATAKASAGSIQFLDKTVLNVGEGSKVSLDQYVYDAGKGGGQALFKMAQGTFRAVTGEIVKHSPESFKIQSPLATIGIRGTETAHAIPPAGGNENHLVMVFDGKPVIVQPLGGGDFQVMSQAGVKVQVGKFGAGPVLVMTPQEYKYFQGLTESGIQQGVPTDNISTGHGVVSQAQDAAAQAAADAVAKAEAAATAKAAAEAAAETAAGSGDPAAKAAALAAAEAAAKAALEAKAAAELAAKAQAGAFAAQQALALAEAAKATADFAAQQGQMAPYMGTSLTLTLGSIFNLASLLSPTGTSGPGTAPSAGTGTAAPYAPLLISPAAQEQIIHIPPLPPPPTEQPATTAEDQDIIGTSGADVLLGNEHANSIEGRAGDDTLEGGASDDTMDGGDGTDTASYAASTDAVTVNLATGDASGGDAEGDTLVSIENLTGSAYADALTGDAGGNVLTGGAGDDTLEGGPGSDTLDGGDGTDTASYAASAQAVAVNLATGDASGGDAAGDTLVSIENLTGSAYADTLTGDAGGNVLTGGTGADALDGGCGTDTASYTFSTAGVTVSLATGTGLGGSAEGDTLVSIENLIGSAYADTLIGDGNANALNGMAGNDILRGGLGADTLTGTAGSDMFAYNTQSEGGDTIASSDFVSGEDMFGFFRTTVGGDFGYDNTTTAQGHVYTSVAAFNDAGSGSASWYLDETNHRLMFDGDGVGAGAAVVIAENVGSLAATDIVVVNADYSIEFGPYVGTTYTGTAGADNFTGGAGDDTFVMGANLASADTIDGGGGTDTLTFTPSSSAPTALAGVTSVEHVVLANPASAVTLTLPSTIVASGDTLDFDAHLLTRNLTLNASGLAGALDFTAGTGKDSITGSAQDDTFRFGTHLTGNDSINGGAGADTLMISDIGQNPTDLKGVSNVETVELFGSGLNIAVTQSMAQTLVGSMDHLTVDGSALTASLTFDASKVTGNYDFYLTGGAGNDVMKGGAGSDRLFGGPGADTLSGGSGSDLFIYKTHGQGGDTITGFASGTDKFAFYSTNDGGNFGYASTAAAQLHVYSSVTAFNDADSGVACWYLDETNHRLMFDADGDTGSGAAITIASGVSSLAATDVIIVDANHTLF